MEWRIYDRDLNLVGITENASSVLWNRKYYEPGSFEMHVPITDMNMNLLQMGRLVTYRGAVEAGIVEDIRFYDSNTQHEIVVRGRFLSSYMDRRLIKSTVQFSGTVENAMRQLLSGCVAIPHVVLGNYNSFTETVQFQATYKNLLDYEVKLAKAASYGFRFRPDFTAKTMTFEIYKGNDHSVHQHDRNHVVFSDGYGNLGKAEYHENSQIFKNVAYVGGEGEGSERTVITVGNTEATGFDLREMFVDARDIRSDEATAEEYEQSLTQRGLENLKSNLYSKAFECETQAEGNFMYKTHYDLGDIVTVRKEAWNAVDDLRITELIEIYEHEHLNVSRTFGDPLPQTIDWRDDY